MRSILISIATASVVTMLAGAQPRYVITDLDASDPFSVALGINNAGHVGGAIALPQNPAVQFGALWRNGQLKNAGSLGGFANGSRPNGRDEMALFSETSDQDPGGEDFCYVGNHKICLGALWSHGRLSPLPPLPGGRNSQGSLVNDRGQVVGTAESGTQDQTCATASTGQLLRFEAVIWNQNGIPQQLKPYADDTVGIGFAINDAGQAVGTTGNCANTTLMPLIYGPRAVLWDQNGVATDLGSLSTPPSNFNTAVMINNRGEVAGGSKIGSGALHSFFWTKATGMTDLGTVENDLGSAPGISGLNNAGQVVGVSCVNDPACNFFNPSFEGRAYLWQDGKMMDLNALVVGGAQLYLVNASGINDAGEIVGLGIDSAGNPHAFLATPVAGGSEGTDAMPRPGLSQAARKVLRKWR